ncbi:MAG: hypothetical protein Q4F65_12975 [Propionibacteriaceae bacterium]|nr:hypothetical protein [Propionibacteriaceae bacterium]
MICTATARQEFDAITTVGGRVITHRAGIEMTVTWAAGQARTTRAEVEAAVAQLLAQITDTED